ncbi:MAG: hypothetical protein FJX54_18130 [Alphaproteobacteria bacterium]|nr:hypothetical protein [Alphaproteobacteria bacterium]
MALCPPEELQKLAEIFKEKAPAPAARTLFDKTVAFLKTTAAPWVAEWAVKTAINDASGLATVTVGVGVASTKLFPLASALGPWIAAARIANQATGIFALYDLKEAATRDGVGGYPCTCGKCVKNIQYVIDKKEGNVAVIALSVFTLGLAAAVDRVNSARKAIDQKLTGARSEKGEACDSLRAGAEQGCICALGAILMLCGEWKTGESNAKLTIEATAVIFSTDGTKRLKGKF